MTVLLTLFAILILPTGWAVPPHYSSLCAANVFAVRALHNAVPDSKSTTHDAFNRLMHFRGHDLASSASLAPETPLKPMWIQGSKATPQELGEVAHRLQIFREHYRAQDSPSVVNLHAGATLTGSDHIVNFEKTILRHAKLLSRFPRSKKELMDHVLIYGADFFGVVNMFAFAYNTHILIVQADFSPMLLINIPYLIYSTERTLRIALARNWQLASETKKMESLLDSGEDWLFTSRVERLPGYIVADSWNTSPYAIMHPELLRSHERETDFGRMSMAAIFKLMGHSAPVDRSPYVMVNRLIRKDPKTDQATLTIFVSVSTQPFGTGNLRRVPEATKQQILQSGT